VKLTYPTVTCRYFHFAHAPMRAQAGDSSFISMASPAIRGYEVVRTFDTYNNGWRRSRQDEMMSLLSVGGSGRAKICTAAEELA
jgi:hypothetical protein